MDSSRVSGLIVSRENVFVKLFFPFAFNDFESELDTSYMMEP